MPCIVADLFFVEFAVFARALRTDTRFIRYYNDLRDTRKCIHHDARHRNGSTSVVETCSQSTGSNRHPGPVTLLPRMIPLAGTQIVVLNSLLASVRGSSRAMSIILALSEALSLTMNLHDRCGDEQKPRMMQFMMLCVLCPKSP